MIEIHQFGITWGRLDSSPFCGKVETYCLLAGVPYVTKAAMTTSGPRGKLPFIVDGGRKIPDSANIIAHLQATHGNALDRGLTDEQAALGHLLRQTCEESLYFATMYSQWQDDAHWPKLRIASFGHMPPIVRDVLPGLVRPGIKKILNFQGYGRYPPAELYALADKDLSAIAWRLSKTTFAVGESVTSFDATVYAFVHNLLHQPFDTPLKLAASNHPSLTAYAARIDAFIASVQAKAAA